MPYCIEMFNIIILGLTICNECELEASDDSTHSQYLHLFTVAVAMETLQRDARGPIGVCT